MLLLHELDPEIQGMSSHPLNSGLSNLVERPPFAKGALFGNRKALRWRFVRSNSLPSC